MLLIHAGKGAGDDYGPRFVACFMLAADEVALPDDPEFRSALRAYMHWAVGDVLRYAPHGSQVPSGSPRLGRSAESSRRPRSAGARGRARESSPAGPRVASPGNRGRVPLRSGREPSTPRSRGTGRRRRSVWSRCLPARPPRRPLRGRAVIRSRNALLDPLIGRRRPLRRRRPRSAAASTSPADSPRRKRRQRLRVRCSRPPRAETRPGRKGS